MKNVLKAIAYTILVIIALAYVINSVQRKRANSRTTISRPAKPSNTDYSSASALDYRKGVLGQYQQGTLLTCVGEITQIIGDNGAMIASKWVDQVGYSGEQILLTFESKPQLIENDIAEISGRYVGPKKFRTVLGVEKEVPLIYVDYYRRAAIWK